jgi:two-component system, cell cycle sensor histidine kinase and response regulator CckA
MTKKEAERPSPVPDERLTAFARGLGHDFANSLAGILGNLRLAQGSLPEGAPALEDLAEIESAVHGAVELVHKLRLYAGRTQIVLVPLSLEVLVAALKPDLVRATAGAALELAFPRDLPEVAGDGELLKSVISSLVLNAREAVGDREGGRVRVGASSEADEVCLEISDNGAGMSDEVRARAFDPYFTTKPHKKGLSLSVALGAARAHNARLELDSAVGRGTTVRLIFPRVLR